MRVRYNNYCEMNAFGRQAKEIRYEVEYCAVAFEWLITIVARMQFIYTKTDFVITFFVICRFSSYRMDFVFLHDF